jgi:hypothetical protein
MRVYVLITFGVLALLAPPTEAASDATIERIEWQKQLDGPYSAPYSPKKGARFLVVYLSMKPAELKNKDIELVHKNGSKYPSVGICPRTSGGICMLDEFEMKPGTAGARTVRIVFDIPSSVSDGVVSLRYKNDVLPVRLPK